MLRDYINGHIKQGDMCIQCYNNINTLPAIEHAGDYYRDHIFLAKHGHYAFCMVQAGPTSWNRLLDEVREG